VFFYFSTVHHSKHSIEIPLLVEILAKIVVRTQGSGGGGIILKKAEEDQLKKTKIPETKEKKEI
jgi:hypothetical protein